MSWAVGYRNGRWIGYGVPAVCDHPGCGAKIDRGLSYACGGGITSDLDNCGLFFCGKHLKYTYFDPEGQPIINIDWYIERFSEEAQEKAYDACSTAYVCERCALGMPRFKPTPDTDEWLIHQLTDETWAKWREENPDQVVQALVRVSEAPVFNPRVKMPKDDLDPGQVWAWMNARGVHPGHWAVRGTGVII